MDLLPTEEQRQIIDASVSFLEKALPVSDLLLDNGNKPLIDRAKLQQIAGLGWFGIGLAEEHGGIGYGLPEETLLFIELGRYLVSTNVLAGVMAARIAAQTGDTALLNDLLEGKKRAAISAATYSTKAQIGATITGEFNLYEADDADLFLFVDNAGAALVDKRAALDSGKATIEPAACIDGNVALNTASLQQLPALTYLSSAQDDIYLRGTLLSAAMLLGIAEATRDRCVAYAKVREQYGQAIGSFQAIKHYCANMAVRCESVRSLLCYASITQQNNSSARYDTQAAKALAVEAAALNTNTAVQIHGGMGFTQELDIHLFVKRKHILEQLFGGKRQHLRELLAQGEPAL